MYTVHIYIYTFTYTQNEGIFTYKGFKNTQLVKEKVYEQRYLIKNYLQKWFPGPG